MGLLVPARRCPDAEADRGPIERRSGAEGKERPDAMGVAPRALSELKGDRSRDDGMGD